MPAPLTKDDPVYKAIRSVEMAAEIERLTVELAEERKEKEQSQAAAATLRGEWLGAKNERDAAYKRAESETLRAETAERALTAMRPHTSRAPSYYNDIHVSSFLSHGVLQYVIVATEYHGNEARINVDPDTLVAFASEALAVAMADKAAPNGHWTRPWQTNE